MVDEAVVCAMCKGNPGKQKLVMEEINKKFYGGGDFILKGWEFQFPIFIQISMIFRSKSIF